LLFPRYMVARSRKKSAASRTSAANTIRPNNSCSRGPELRPLLSQRMCEMSNLETYREKALKCVRAAEEIHGSRERVELLGLASVYMALADYVDRGHEHDAAHRSDQCQDMQKNS
jgi:hypothetical protein